VHRVEIVGEVRLECEAESGTCLNGVEIVASAAEVDAVTNTPRFVDGTPFGAPKEQELRLFGRYRVRSERDSFGSVVALHFGEVVGISGEKTLVFRHRESEYERAVRIEGEDTVGVIVSLEKEGVFLVSVVDENGEVPLCREAKIEREFVVGPGESFYEIVGMCREIPDDGMGLGKTVWIVVACMATAVVGVGLGVLVWKRRTEAPESLPVLKDEDDASYRTSEA
jgi:hypothetical protein